MTIENPPRLWAFAVRGAIHAAPEEAPLLASVHQGWGAAKPQAYVREDDANAEIAEARQAREEEGGLRREIEADRDAVRRERDALLSGEFAQRVAAEREAYRAALEKVVSLMRPAHVWEPWQALAAAEDALGVALSKPKYDFKKWADEIRAMAAPVEADRDAVRRERDALLAERDAVAREGWRACVLGVSIIRFWQAETKSRSGDQRGALALMNEAVALRDIFTADDKAAGKGVG